MPIIDDYKINNSSYTWEKMYLIDMIGLNATKNTNYIEKCFKGKLRRIKFPKNNLIRRMPLCTPKVELRGSKDLHFWKIIMYWNEKVHFGAVRCKKYQLPIISENSWNKSCAKLNFLKKSQWTHIYLKPAIHLSSNWREYEKILAKWKKWEVYR